MHKAMSEVVKLDLVKLGQTSAGTAVNSDSVDMAGYEGVLFFGKMATSNAANFANAAQSADDTTFIDLKDTKIVPGDDDDIWLIDVFKPTDRYVRCEVDRGGADTATGEIYAIQYGARKPPVTHATEVDSEIHLTPDEGTA